ncbi:hypothetical protein HFO97_34925 [Rhizobium leguminosarum]|uniref:hypothetical protein n=1 Tax=Rhizobium leguminosarum TaxID=384 RepID=UPI001C950481|nr:hypothetical protein [Rhizobium leguminosarum]MBY5365029.1 hypothetical protein [Rhizobium leguminosarum]
MKTALGGALIHRKRPSIAFALIALKSRRRSGPAARAGLISTRGTIKGERAKEIVSLSRAPEHGRMKLLHEVIGGLTKEVTLSVTIS